MSTIGANCRSKTRPQSAYHQCVYVVHAHSTLMEEDLRTRRYTPTLSSGPANSRRKPHAMVPYPLAIKGTTPTRDRVPLTTKQASATPARVDRARVLPRCSMDQP